MLKSRHLSTKEKKYQNENILMSERTRMVENWKCTRCQRHRVLSLGTLDGAWSNLSKLKVLLPMAGGTTGWAQRCLLTQTILGFYCIKLMAFQQTLPSESKAQHFSENKKTDLDQLFQEWKNLQQQPISAFSFSSVLRCSKEFSKQSGTKRCMQIVPPWGDM